MKMKSVRNSERILPYYTYDVWVRWEGLWELIDGLPFAITSSSDIKHQVISGNLAGEFVFLLKACQKCDAYLPIAYRVSDDTILQPDLLVVGGEITKEYLDFVPTLVAEIISSSTKLKDRYVKYNIYESQGIKYYIIIAPDKEEVEIYELIEGEYKLKQSGKNIVHEFFFPDCTALVDFKEIW
jgi:Uma2 family endonuclease